MYTPNPQNFSGLEPGIDLDMDTAAAHLGLPRNILDSPVVAELVGFLTRVEELQEDLYRAAGANRPTPAFLDGTHDLYERYHAAEQLLRVALAILREGLGPWDQRIEPGSGSIGYLTEKLTNAVKPYGIVVRERTPAESGR